MGSLRQQLPLLIIGPVIILAICLTTVIGIYLKDRALLATTTKAKSDLLTGETIVDLMYPGPWSIKGGILYKGNVKISNNFTAVDRIATLTGDTATVFLGDIRVSTTVREKNGERAVGTVASDIVANTVLKNGQEFIGEANVVGEFYQTAYKPIRDTDGKIIGMFYVGISKKFTDELLRDSLVKMVAISIGFTILVSIGAWYFSQKAILGPLEQITKGTLALATGRHYSKVDISMPNEFSDLALAFNYMVDGMQRLATQINKTTKNVDNELGEENKNAVNLNQDDSKEVTATLQTNRQTYDELPKGLNETTLRQIITFLRTTSTPMSAEEVGEGVKLTRVTARRYLEFLEKNGFVSVELKYGTVGRPVKLYSGNENT